jgi:hypothetical protein
VIETINANTKLYYNFGSGPVEVKAGTPINNFNVNNLVIYGQNGSGNSANPFGFTYALTDAAGVKSQPVNYIITTNAPLPVTLISFEVKTAEKAANLYWVTSTETNSDRFEVQRRMKSTDWETIGNVDAKGESAVKQTYDFTDKEPKAGENLYRLKMIDRDGTFAYSRISSATFEQGQGLETYIYPNPVSDQLYLKTADWSLVRTVSIFDTAGKTVYSSGEKPSEVVDVKNLQPGMYLVRVTQKDGATTVHKVIRIK